jgi:alpha-tubulin N-acetyltransferase 1
VPTTSDKFFNENNLNDRLFLKAKGNTVLGYLKVGPRYLFLSDSNGESNETNINAVLDFYTHFKYQNQGIGKTLFNKMLRILNTEAHKIAYDNPNDKLLNFLYKHYSLKNGIKQNNMFLVFPDYFNV